MIFPNTIGPFVVRYLRMFLATALFVGLIVAAPAEVQANHEGRTLQVTPEMDRNPQGTLHEFIATISPPAGSDGSVLIDYKIKSGPNALSQDPAMNLFTAPDGSCTIPSGSSSCTLRYTDRRAYAGTDLVFFWIDHDGDNATAEVDESESHNAGGPPDEPGCPQQQCGPPDDSGAGDIPEPDSTDVVLKEWGQMRTSSLPYIDGKGLFLASDPVCETQRTRRKGRVILTAVGCLSTFALSSESESDGLRDHGALWAQSSVDASSGWCATRVVTKILLPNQMEVLGKAPSDSKAGKRRAKEVLLVVGHTGIMGSVPNLLQSFLELPGRIRVRQNDDGSVVRLIWRGSTRKKVAVALGAWVSFPQGEDINTLDVASVLTHRAVKQARC